MSFLRHVVVYRIEMAIVNKELNDYCSMNEPEFDNLELEEDVNMNYGRLYFLRICVNIIMLSGAIILRIVLFAYQEFLNVFVSLRIMLQME